MTASALALLFSAIILVESGGNVNAVGDNGNAVGPAQIWKIVIDDVNRIAKTNYTYEDRKSVEKSFEVFTIYTNYYIKKKRLPDTAENRSRLWNGGPNGADSAKTLRYWHKVKSKL